MWGIYRVDAEYELVKGCAPDLPRARMEVIPEFGPQHVRGDDCWCRPWRDPNRPTLRVHQAPPS